MSQHNPPNKRNIVHSYELTLLLLILVNFAYFPVAPALFFGLVIPAIQATASYLPLGGVEYVILFYVVSGVLLAIFDYREIKALRAYYKPENETDYNKKSRRKEEKHAADTPIF